MWLIHVKTFELEFFHDEEQVKYAILSHRWFEEEVSHRDMLSASELPGVKVMKGWTKIQKCCEQAANDGLRYAWVDTCCIDKSSSAEPQGAINSMFRWYQEAEVCYAFLSHVWFEEEEIQLNVMDLLEEEMQFDETGPFGKHVRQSQWFKRGWTLQELVAPRVVKFSNSEGRYSAFACPSQGSFITPRV